MEMMPSHTSQKQQRAIEVENCGNLWRSTCATLLAAGSQSFTSEASETVPENLFRLLSSVRTPMKHSAHPIYAPTCHRRVLAISIVNFHFFIPPYECNFDSVKRNERLWVLTILTALLRELEIWIASGWLKDEKEMNQGEAMKRKRTCGVGGNAMEKKLWLLFRANGIRWAISSLARELFKHSISMREKTSELWWRKLIFIRKCFVMMMMMEKGRAEQSS